MGFFVCLLVFIFDVYAYSALWLYFNVTNANSPIHSIQVQANQQITVSYSSVITH